MYYGQESDESKNYVKYRTLSSLNEMQLKCLLTDIQRSNKQDEWRYRSINVSFGIGYTNFDNAWKAIKTAITYWNAKKSGTMSFGYQDGHGCLKGSTSAILYDENQNSIMDCSTFIGLVLRGISSLDSPYYNSQELTCNPQDVICRNESWTESYFDKQEQRYTKTPVFPCLGYQTKEGYYRVLTASDICQYYDKMGLTWLAENEPARTGDLCFFCKREKDGSLKYPDRFLGISHVGIMLDSEYYLNVTELESAGNLVRTAVVSRKPYMYARPIYGALNDGVANGLTQGKIDLIPDVWSGLKQGVSKLDGRRLILEKKN